MEDLLKDWELTNNGNGTITVSHSSGSGVVVEDTEDEADRSIAGCILYRLAEDIIELSK